MKVHVCKSSSEPENHNEGVGKAVGEGEGRGVDGEVVKGEHEAPRPEDVRASNDVHRLLGNDNLLIKGVASDKVEGTEERTPSLLEKREYSVLYETEENQKNSDAGR